LPKDNEFAAWIAPHVGRLTRISRAFAAPSDRHDLMQELLIAVWKARPAFRGDAAPSTFVYRVAHNRALTWKRREGLRWLRFPILQGDVPDAAEPAPDDRLERLYAAIRQLPPVDRSLMLLSLDGVPYTDMSALHGLSEANIGARLTRARARLMALIGETSDGL
jgi:RNA polymerase sigma-70 factor (ECF subfamily)